MIDDKFFFYDYKTGNFETTDNNNYIKMFLCIQEILLWKGENYFDIEQGVDWNSIFNGKSNLRLDIEDILDKYKIYFRDITFDFQIENNILYIDLAFYFNQEENATISKNPNARFDTMQSNKVRIAKNHKGEVKSVRVI